jgi:hypothetical protein
MWDEKPDKPRKTASKSLIAWITLSAIRECKACRVVFACPPTNLGTSRERIVHEIGECEDGVGLPVGSQKENFTRVST